MFFVKKIDYCFICLSDMNTEAIQRVAQNLPSHMMQTLSAVANQTPHYPHTPGGAYGAPNYINTVRISAVTFTINVQKLRRFFN